MSLVHNTLPYITLTIVQTKGPLRTAHPTPGWRPKIYVGYRRAQQAQHLSIWYLSGDRCVV
jgi:hypothetical protein